MELTTLLYWITGFAAALIIGWLFFALCLGIEWLAGKWPALKRFIEKYS